MIASLGQANIEGIPACGWVVPRKDEGKLIALAVMVVGIGFIALLTGAIAQRFLAPAVEQIEEEVESSK